MSQPAPPPGPGPEALIGTWELVDFVVHASDGRAPRHPFGTHARGRIIYGADGHMSAVLSRGDRAPTGPGGLETAHRATPAARVAAYDSYLSYSGRWTLEGDHVHHHVDLALVPDVVGQVMVRRLGHEPSGRITLSYALRDRKQVEHRFELRWRRASAPDPLP